jgi:competence protein ComEA
MDRRDASAPPGRLAAVLASARPAEPVRGRPVAPDAAVPPRRHYGPGDAPDEPARGTRGRAASLRDRWVPAAWHGARLDPGRPGAIALLLVAAAAAVLAAVGVWRQAPRSEPVADLPAVVETPAPSSAAAASTSPAPVEFLVVAVAGKVARPGLVRVPPGARVADVLAAAGGPLPGTDLTGLNLARKVSDGEQVAVGVPAAPDAAAPPAAAGGGGAPTAAGAPVDLNAATVEQLDALPGVGPVTAQRIVEWRTRNGRFGSVDQLREIEGIGERRFAQLRGLVRV